MACATFDQQLVGPDPELRRMMEDFICVRVIQGNAMDLKLFQFDYDMSFGVHFLNSDRTVYARYGSRRGNGEESDDEMSTAGLREVMTRVLAAHQGYPENKASLAGKQPKADVPYPVPEANPLLSKYQAKLDYEGKVAGSCLHCHQIGSSEIRGLRDSGSLLSFKKLTPYPMPSVLGIEIDPQTATTVKSVNAESPAEAAGLAVGDQIEVLDGQIILSLADIQWVLHHFPEAGELNFRVRRGAENKAIAVTLKKGWERNSDISWRVSTWDLGRMATGGMRMERVSEEERKKLGIEEGGMALRAKHVGQYNDHAVAKRAGFENGDVIVSFAGITEDLDEGVLIRTILGKYKRGETAKIEYLRNGRKLKASIQLQ